MDTEMDTYLEDVSYDDLFDYYEDSFYQEPNLIKQFQYLVKNILVPTIYQAFQLLYPIIFASVFFKCLISKTNLTITKINFIITFFSISILIYMYKLKLVYYILFLVLISYFLSGNFFFRFITIPVTVFHLLFGQFILFSTEDWNSIKGIEMILVMKIISYYLDRNELVNGSLISYMSYSLSINTSVFGPWVSFKDYTNFLNNRNSLKLKIPIGALKTFLSSIFCLILSNCLINCFDILSNSYNFGFITRIYFEALSFRLSNYFICFFSQSICEVSELEHSSQENNKDNSTIKIIKPKYVEMPRSLIDVVTNWNLPMHYWLKTYVFKTTKAKHGNLSALSLTYFTSTFLHGFDVNISLVLFSLGVYTYIENGVRKCLASLFSTCIEARNCNNKCNHRLKSSYYVTKLVNSFFSILTVYHLAYLGQLFYNEFSDIQSNNLETSLTKWYMSYFSSHLIIVFEIILLFILKRIKRNNKPKE